MCSKNETPAGGVRVKVTFGPWLLASMMVIRVRVISELQFVIVKVFYPLLLYVTIDVQHTSSSLHSDREFGARGGIIVRLTLYALHLLSSFIPKRVWFGIVHYS